MGYYFNKEVSLSFDQAIDKVTEELKREGFGILTEIDVKETLKKKLDVDFRDYRILGACNPPFAHRSLLAEDKIGIMMPCNVVVQVLPSGRTEVAAMDPAGAMQAVENPKLQETAGELREALKRVIDRL